MSLMLQMTSMRMGFVFFIIFVSDGKFDNLMGVRKRTDLNLPRI